MRVVIHKGFGGFSCCIDDDILEKLGYPTDTWEEYEKALMYIRDDPRFIEYAPSIKGLSVVEVPDNATDWKIFEYDGAEWIVCVIDGKLVEIY